MNNGDGDDNNDTPNELPSATLDAHRPYVLALTAVIAPLQATVHTLAQVLHEIRIARDPIGRGTVRSIADAGAELEEVGRKLRVGFGGG